MSKKDYIGTRWYKCDLHLHTPASKCFEQDGVTAEDWVNAAIDNGLKCVAVTDHNSGAWIDNIIEAAKDKGLIVFPGVELTCSDAKVHLLVLFDVDKGKQDVEDFLLLAGIERKDQGEKTAHTNKSIEDILKLSIDRDAIVIPAHIDEYNGLSEVGNESSKDYFKKEYFNGVQIANEILGTKEEEYNKDEVKTELSTKYGGDISDDLVKKWRNSFLMAIQYNKALLTFSDNPNAEGSSKHGLWGIGKRYTWIKMDANPSLESLRQALLLHNFRIRNDFECKDPDQPFKSPELWIKNIEIFNTEITGDTNPLKVEFSPQMTTIIGGRGSGKSSILRFIRGVFKNKVAELEILEDIKSEFDRFFKYKDKKSGVLLGASKITIEFIRKDVSHIIEFLQENNKSKKLTIKRFDEATESYKDISDENYVDFFEFDIFSQKQIYEISTKTNSLRNRIDDIVPEISEIKTDLNKKLKNFITKSSEIRGIEAEISGKGKLQTEIKDIEERIKTFNESGVNDIIKSRQDFEKDTTTLQNYRKNIEGFKEFIEETFSNIEIPEFELNDLQEKYKEELETIQKEADGKINLIKEGIQKYIEEVQQIHDQFEEKVKKTQWFKDDEESKEKLEAKKKELAEKGITDLEEIEKEIKDVEKKKTELKEIEKKEENLKKELENKSELKTQYITRRKELTGARKNFLNEILEGRNVRAKIKAFRDFQQYENQFREIIGKQDGYIDDFKHIVEMLEHGEAVNNNKNLTDRLKKIYLAQRDDLFGGYFNNLIPTLSGEDMDKLDLLLPEDDIIIEYKTKTNKEFKSISNASAGQKTAAILTLLLSHGEVPLILDQPEDDLDNHLIYELVVDQLRHSKEYRQIIVVTHNANIPVNGDSEYIVGMNSESKNIEVLKQGAIESREIKDEICQVMEGGTEAFEMRSKRYNLI